MTITLEIRPELQAELARRAAANGVPIDTYAAGLLEEAAHLPAEADKDRPAIDKNRAQAAGARIRELRKGVTLGGLTIRELIDEGRP